MRLIHITLACLLFVGAPLMSVAAATTTVRAIAFVASHESGRSDPQLAPFEGVLRNNLRFESFRYVGESSAPVAPGGSAQISLAGSRIKIDASPSGEIRAEHRGTSVAIAPGRPAVFMGGPAGKGQVSGIIVMAQ